MYSLIGQSEMERLRQERLASLELDHYRHTLLLREATNSREQSALRTELADLERRMAIHQPPDGESQDDESGDADRSELPDDTDSDSAEPESAQG